MNSNQKYFLCSLVCYKGSFSVDLPKAVKELHLCISQCQYGGQTCSCCSWLRLASSLREHSILFCSSITLYSSAACTHTKTHKLYCQQDWPSLVRGIFTLDTWFQSNNFFLLPATFVSSIQPPLFTSASLELTVSERFWIFRSCRWASSWADRSSSSISPRCSCSFYKQHANE